MYKIYAELRDGRGLTDYAVAKALGFPSGMFTNWKKGRYTPKVDKIKKIAEFFGVPLERLVA